MDPNDILAQLRGLNVGSQRLDFSGAAADPLSQPGLNPGLPPGLEHAAAAARMSAAQQQLLGMTPRQTSSARVAMPNGALLPSRNTQQPPLPRRRSNDEKVRRTVYITDVDQAVGEEQLAAFFQSCGPIVDCRICGDPNSSMRFAFVEFLAEAGARAALARNGALLGAYAIRVGPSKTAIVPVNNQYLPRSEHERVAVARTVYVANVDRVVERDALCEFFQNLCGPVDKIRLLGDAAHNTKIAFIEFAQLKSAHAALKCSGALLGALPIRVSPSKTKVRVDSKRQPADATGAALAQELLSSAALPSATVTSGGFPLAGAGAAIPSGRSAAFPTPLSMFSPFPFVRHLSIHKY